MDAVEVGSVCYSTVVNVTVKAEPIFVPEYP